jgi:hypothetical protein
MMLRAVVVAAIASACVSCKPGSDDPVGYGGATSVTPGHVRGARTKQSPTDVLAGKHRAPIELVAQVPVPGGSAIAYTYGRLQSRIGEEINSGRDVKAELEEAERKCEEVRTALEPSEREWVESEYLSCEAVAGTQVFNDDQLVPDCQALGVAYFDPEGILLSNVELGGSCLSVHRKLVLEAYDLTPEPDDELMLTARFATFGELTRGGWGTAQGEMHLFVLAIRPGELVEQLDLELDVDVDGGNCGHGTSRSVRIPQVGLIEVYSQEYSECDQEGCVSAEEAEVARQELEDDEVPPEYDICPTRPVEAEQTRWVPEEQSWTVLEGIEFEGSELPDGIRG